MRDIELGNPRTCDNRPGVLHHCMYTGEIPGWIGSPSLSAKGSQPPIKDSDLPQGQTINELHGGQGVPDTSPETPVSRQRCLCLWHMHGLSRP